MWKRPPTRCVPLHRDTLFLLPLWNPVDRSQNRSKTVTPSSSRETSPSDEVVDQGAVIPPPEGYAEPREQQHRLRVPSPSLPAGVTSSVDMESSIQTIQQSGENCICDSGHGSPFRSRQCSSIGLRRSCTFTSRSVGDRMIWIFLADVLLTYC